jgi:nicotinate-nucleotide adenylyltransferase
MGHLLVALAAREELSLTRLVFVPAAQSPFKSGEDLAPASERARLLRLALAGFTGCDVDEQEIIRGGVSYTIDTVMAYRERFPEAELFYLIGGDLVPQLPDWRDAGRLAGQVEFVVLPRPGEPKAVLPPPFRGRHLGGFPVSISSSEIRRRVRAGLPVDLLTPPAVAEAIRQNRLYL